MDSYDREWRKKEKTAGLFKVIKNIGKRGLLNGI